MKQYRLCPGPNRERPFLAVMLGGFPELGKYLTIEGDTVIVDHEDWAGSGAAFVLAAFASLAAGEPLALRDMVALDPPRRVVFLAALAAWLEG